MRITFIRPHLMDDRSADAMEPLVFAILAGLTPPDVELDLFDERIEPIPEDHDTDLLALTVETFTARRAYQIATHFRERDIPVVMEATIPASCPKRRWCMRTRLSSETRKKSGKRSFETLSREGYSASTGSRTSRRWRA